jgi:excisionase family DNA binding protein
MDREFELLTLGEAAALLKVSVVTISRWIKQGRILAYHVGPRKVRINRADLAKALTPTQQEGVSEMPETIPPLTDAQVQQGRAALKESDSLIARLRQRRQGQPLSPSWQLIREEREERAKRL